MKSTLFFLILLLLIQNAFGQDKEPQSGFDPSNLLIIAAGVAVILIGLGLMKNNKGQPEIQNQNSTNSEDTSSNPNSNSKHSSASSSNFYNSIPKQIPIVTETFMKISQVEKNTTEIATSQVPTFRVHSSAGMQVHKILKLPMSIGRNDNNDLVIKDITVSGNHATFAFENGYFIIRDENSTNGIIIDNQKVTEYHVKDGQKLLLGNAVLEFYFS